MAPRLTFDDFEFDCRSGQLWRSGVRVHLQDLPGRLLATLIERPGELVTRAEIAERLWGTSTYVDAEAGINTAVAKLRDALGDTSGAPRFVETVPRRGYRFIGAIATAPKSAPVPAVGVDPRAGRRRRLLIVGAAALAVLAAIGVLRGWGDPPAVRVAVALFDNETADADLDRYAQALTDSTVLRLGADRRLSVIGNAAILRRERPLRDLLSIRDALAADFIVIGQIQDAPGGRRVLAHLIRGADQAHVWVNGFPLRPESAAQVEAEVVAAIADALSAELEQPAPARSASTR